MSDQPFIELLPSVFVEQQIRAVELARAVKSQSSTREVVQKELNELLGQGLANQVLQSLTEPNAPVATVDKNQPTILLTSFKGCKGLSAGHVFIVGVHDGGMPRDNKHIDDVEISQFVVALTRTRKQCQNIYQTTGFIHLKARRVGLMLSTFDLRKLDSKRVD